MKKTFILALTFLMLFGLVSIVSASESGKLIIWSDSKRIEVLDNIVGKFEEEYGVPVVLQEKAYDSINKDFTVQAPTGEGPDIIIVSHDPLGELISNGLLEPIDLGAKEKDFYDVAIRAFKWGDKLYGLPYAIESIGLIYNKDIIPDPPRNWSVFEQIIREVTDKKGGVYGFAMPQPDPYHTFPFMSACGGYVFGTKEGVLDPTDIGLNNEGAICGLTKLESLYEEEVIPYVDYNDMESLFIQGKLGMMVTGPWAFSKIEETGINYGFVQIPTIEGNAPKPFVGVQGFLISSFSKNKMLAKAFLTDFIAQKDILLEFYKNGKRPPAFKPAADEVKKDPIVAGLLKSASAGIPMPKIPEMTAVWSAWTDALELILTQKQDIKPALDDAVNRISKKIEENN